MLRQWLGFLADSLPWVGKLRTVLPSSDVIRDSAVQLGLTHQRIDNTGGGGEQWLEARRNLGAGVTPYCPIYGVRHDVTVHSLTMMLCEALFGGDLAAASDPRMQLRDDGAAVGHASPVGM
jgi:hypothetical protein